MKYDMPPSENVARPNYDSKIERRIRDIGRTDSGMPFLRIVWGASMESSYMWAGERHMVYRDHVDRDYRIGWPAYNLDGSFSHYQKLFKPGDVTPPDAYLEGICLETDIGIPRFFIEYATAVDADEWEIARWTDDAGQVRIDEKTGDALDFRGPCPEGAVIYEPLWLCAEHKGCCKVGQMNIGHKADGEQCFGTYRDPNMRDVRECEARWANVLLTRSGTYGLRDAVPGELIKQDVSTHAIGHRDYWLKKEQDIADDFYQNTIPHSKRLTTHTHGLDLFKYKDVGDALKQMRKNANDPTAWSPKEYVSKTGEDE